MHSICARHLFCHIEVGVILISGSENSMEMLPGLGFSFNSNGHYYATSPSRISGCAV